MVYYCPNCWIELPDVRCVCPQCNQQVASWDERTLEAKLLQFISAADPLKQDHAVHLLGEKKNSRAVGPLTEVFRQPYCSDSLKIQIIRAVANIGGEAACSLVIEALQHRWFIVRAEAAKALGQFSGSNVKQALEESLNDSSSYVREVARGAIDSLASGNRINSVNEDGVEGTSRDPCCLRKSLDAA